MRDLEDAYRKTTYEAETELGKVEIHVGHVTANIDKLLETHNCKTWAFITAANPESKPLSPEENESRNAELLAKIRQKPWVSYPGLGRSQDSLWQPEESFFVLGISLSDACKLGVEFGQNAIVFGAAKSPAELVWCNEYESGISSSAPQALDANITPPPVAWVPRTLFPPDTQAEEKKSLLKTITDFLKSVGRGGQPQNSRNNQNPLGAPIAFDITNGEFSVYLCHLYPGTETKPEVVFQKEFTPSVLKLTNIKVALSMVKHEIFTRGIKLDQATDSKMRELIYNYQDDEDCHRQFMQLLGWLSDHGFRLTARCRDERKVICKIWTSE